MSLKFSVNFDTAYKYLRSLRIIATQKLYADVLRYAVANKILLI